MSIEDKILQRLYIKIIVAGIAALILGVVAAILSKNWQTLLLGGVVLAGFLYTFFAARNNVKKGNVISIYAQCFDATEYRSWVGKRAQKRTTYRFVAQAQSTPFDGDDELMANLFIRADIGKFNIGETYCLLFRKNPEEMYNEESLMTYGAVPPDVLSFSTTNGDNDAEQGDGGIDNLNDISDEPQGNEQKGKLIYFTEEEKGDAPH